MSELDYDYLALLVEKAKQNNSSAFAEIYAATYKKLFNFAYHYVNDYYLAQDILQEVYILAFKNIGRLREPTLCISWLNQITFHVCFHSYKKYKMQEQELDYTDSEELIMADRISDTGHPEQKMLLERENEELLRQVMKLPPKEAKVIIMRYYNEMKLEEIAKAMGISRSTVKRYIGNGKKKLKQLLGEEKGDFFFG